MKWERKLHRNIEVIVQPRNNYVWVRFKKFKNGNEHK
jgi:hypothetical protein